ncbi:MAG: ABC transporter permease, partial [Rhodobacterales bacterium]
IQFFRNLLIEGFSTGFGETATQLVPPLSWIAIVVCVALVGRYARDWKLAALVGVCFLYLAIFGQWQSAMITLSSILIAVPIGVVGG